MLDLNAEQKRAAGHGEGPLLVVAGPGTGKTRVITQRIVHLLEEGAFSDEEAPLRPENILALTFTEKAAEEMKRRVAASLPDLETLPFISTFHAFCLHILRQRHVDRLLLDKVDVWIFLRRRMVELGLVHYQKLAEPGAFLHDLNDFFSRCQDELIEPEDFEVYVRDCARRFSERHPRLAALLAASRRSTAAPRASALLSASPEEHLEWEEVLKKQELATVFRNSRRLIEDAGASSLGSLVSETVALWKSQPEALAQARSRFRFVLVDEFQDTNYAQVELLKLLAAPPYRISAVGDDDQAIYRFRGASHGAFEMFRQAFPGHAVVYLSQNYRSTQRILRAAGTVIQQNDRYAEKPALTSSNDEGRPVYLLQSTNCESEAAWVAEEVERLARQGTPFGSIAVLYRAHHYRDPLVEEFRRRGVPFRIRGLSILSSTILRDLTAWLRLAHSPHDNVSFTRALLAPRWGFPEDLAQVIRRQATKERRSLYDVLKKNRAPEIEQQLARTEWKEFEKLLRALRKLGKAAPVTSLMDVMVERLGWRYLPGEPEEVSLAAFRKFLEGWEEKSETRRLAEFIEYFDFYLEAGGKIETPEAAALSNAVQMMTVHAAKGLEFPVVFVISVSPRRFPCAERKPVIEFPAALRKGPPPPPNIHLQEERRLFFVALTRAQERLYVSSVSRSEKQQSAFVQDLLSDPVLRAREIEVIRVPDIEPEKNPGDTPPASKPKHPPLKVLLTERLSGQGRLFGSLQESHNGLHPELAEWARRPAVIPPDEKLRLSATSAEDYLGCPLRYKFQHLLRIPTAPQAALTFGNIMHQSVRYYFELRHKTLPSFEQIQEFYLDNWKSLGFDDSYQEETYRRTGLEQLRGFVEKHGTLAVDPRRIQSEQIFHLDLGDVAVEGRIDQINFLDPAGDGAAMVELIDYKTGRPRLEKDAEKSLQLSIYALAAKRILGLNPVRLTFYNFTNNEAVSAARTPEDLDKAVESIREIVSEIRRGFFEAKPGFMCRWCDYKPLCPAHEG